MARSATPRKLPNGHWRIRWIDETNHRQSAVFKSRKEAELELHHRKAEVDKIQRGLVKRAAPPHTFDELFDEWLKNKAPKKRSEKDDRSMIGLHLRPAFGSMRLTDFEVKHVHDYDRTKAGFSPQTRRHHLGLLSTMLDRAVKVLGWLHHRPLIEKPRQETLLDDEDRPWFRTEAEIARFITAAKADGEMVYALYNTAIYTGMREGELAGLRWTDVNFESNTIHVRRSYDGPLKTRGSRRHVPIQKQLVPVFRAWQERCPVTDDDLVFPSEAGTMLEPSSRAFQEILHRVLDRAGFERPARTGRRRQEVHVIHFHSLRHTFACWWRLKGGSMERLQKVLGHTTKEMTEHYANLGPYAFPADLALFDGFASSTALAAGTK